MKNRMIRFISFFLVLVMLFTNCGLSNLSVEAASKKATKKPTKITLNYTKKNLSVGETLKLKVKSATPANASKSVTWSSSNKKIATVSTKGKVKAKKTGSVTITAKSTKNKKVVAKCKFKVYKATKKIKLNSEKSYELTVGQTQKLSAKVTNPKKGAAPIEWSSGNKKVAKVNSKGKVTALSEGKTTIVGKSGKKKVKVSIVVNAVAAGNETGSTKPQDTTTKTDSTTPDNTTSGDKTPGNTTPDDTTSGDKTPGDTTPDDTTTGDTTPGDTTPDDTTSGNTTPDISNPDDNTNEDTTTDNDGEETTPPDNTTPTDTPKTAYTRGEWVAALADKMGYSMSEENLPKDQGTGVTIYNFADIYDNENVLKIEAAIHNGVVPLMADDGSTSDFFFPDDNVTREFAAVTAVRALGYVTDTAIDSSDSASLKYPKEVKVAVEQGMFALKDGAFAPDEFVTEEEFAKIMEIVDASLADWEPDSNHVDTYEYTDAVVESDRQIEDYTVSAVDDKLCVTVSANSLTENLQAGQILLLPANDEFEDGLPLKVESATKVDNMVLIIGQTPDSFEEVFESVDIECIGQIDADNIVLAEGVTFVEDEQTVSGDTLERAGKSTEGELPTPLVDTFEVNLGSDYGTVTLEYGIPNIYCKFDYDRKGVNEVIVKVPNTLTLAYDIEKKWEGKKDIATVPVKLPAGFCVNIKFSLVAEVNGTIHLEYSIENTLGVCYKKGGTLQKIAEHEESWEGEISVEAKAGINMTVEISWMDTARKKLANLTKIDELAMPIYTVGTEVGVGVNASNAYRSSLKINCTDANMWMYWDYFVGEGDTILTALLPSLEHRWEIFDEDNSPLRVNFHFENLRKVDACSYENGNFNITVCDNTGFDLSRVPVTLKAKDSKKSYIYTTNLLGVIENKKLPAGTYDVIVTRYEMEPYAKTIELKEGEFTNLTIVLQPKGSGTPDTDKSDNDSDKTDGKDDDSDKEEFGTDPVNPGTGDDTGNDNDGTSDDESSDDGSTDDGSSDDDSTGEDDSEDEEVTVPILYSGTWNGMDWSINENGQLLITGEDTRTFGTTERDEPDWYIHRSDINTAVVEAKNIKSTYRWFADCSNITSIDLSNIDTSKTFNMERMFAGCSRLTTLDVSNLDTSRVALMGEMFSGCSELTVLDLSNWNIENVWQTDSMFRGCSKLIELNISGWKTSYIQNMSYMFVGCSALTTLNTSNSDISCWSSIGGMFKDCSSLVALDLSFFDTSHVTSMTEMFSGCSSLLTLDLSNLDTSQVTSMAGMFSGCSSLVTLNLNNFDTSNVDGTAYQGMSDMFKGCSSLTTLDLSSFDTSNVGSMEEMFRGCSGLTSLDLSNFDTGNVTTMHLMFADCSGLTTLNISNLNTSEVSDMSWMFEDCIGLTTLDLSNFDTRNVETTNYMFYGCSGLITLDLSNSDMKSAAVYGMLDDCDNLAVVQVPLNISNACYLPRSGTWKDADGNTYITLPAGVTESFEIKKY